MNKELYRRIMNTQIGVPLDALDAWVRTVAPNVKNSRERAYEKGMNDFLGAVCGRENVEHRGTPIPEPSPENRNGFQYDLWLMLGTTGVTMEDIADYVAERKAEIAAQNTASAQSMGFSQMLHAMPGGAESAQEIFAQDQRLKEEGAAFNMSSFLCNIPNGFWSNSCPGNPREAI